MRLVSSRSYGGVFQLDSECLREIVRGFTYLRGAADAIDVCGGVVEIRSV